MSARFEIVRTDAEQPWHARFVAANGRIVFTTEQYGRRASALKALSRLCTEFGYRLPSTVPLGRVSLQHWIHRDAGWRIEIRDVDQRKAGA